MRVEPVFLLGLIIALFALVFYAGMICFILAVFVRDYIHRNDKPESVQSAYNPLEDAIIDLNDPREIAMNRWDGESDPPVI